MTEGEYHSARTIDAVVRTLVPKSVTWGQYYDGDSQVCFIVSDYHSMNFSADPDPVQFAEKLFNLPTKGESPNGMFGFAVPTALGKFERTVRWETSWAKCFTNQLRDVIKYDNEVNGTWPAYDAACTQLIDQVIPRLLRALQSDGRSIEPALIHGDLWEQNVGIDKETGQAILFDPGSTYAHNEMEFGTWRCSWATYFKKPEEDPDKSKCVKPRDSKPHEFKDSVYLRLYKTYVQESDPQEEWDDRNRLYSLHPNLNNSAGHRGSETAKASRVTYVFCVPFIHTGSNIF
jgi:protein-ribulosamine 3-kinase